MYHKYHVKGVVLSSLEEGQDSRRVFVLTDSLGIINAKVMSGRLSSSKMRVSIQEYTLGNFSIVYGKGGWRLVGASTIKNYFEIMRGSFIKLKAFRNISNLLRRLVLEQQMDERLFSVVVNFFDFISSSKESQVFLAECIALLRILYRLGFLDRDISPEVNFESTVFDEGVLSLPYETSLLVSIINSSLKETRI